jgi:hypothetical protein
MSATAHDTHAYMSVGRNSQMRAVRAEANEEETQSSMNVNLTVSILEDYYDLFGALQLVCHYGKLRTTWDNGV